MEEKVNFILINRLLIESPACQGNLASAVKSLIIPKLFPLEFHLERGVKGELFSRENWVNNPQYQTGHLKICRDQILRS